MSFLPICRTGFSQKNDCQHFTLQKENGEDYRICMNQSVHDNLKSRCDTTILASRAFLKFVSHIPLKKVRAVSLINVFHEFMQSDFVLNENLSSVLIDIFGQALFFKLRDLNQSKDYKFYDPREEDVLDMEKLHHLANFASNCINLPKRPIIDEIQSLANTKITLFFKVAMENSSLN